jgi:hypothetical protein
MPPTAPPATQPGSSTKARAAWQARLGPAILIAACVATIGSSTSTCAAIYDHHAPAVFCGPFAWLEWLRVLPLVGLAAALLGYRWTPDARRRRLRAVGLLCVVLTPGPAWVANRSLLRATWRHGCERRDDVSCLLLGLSFEKSDPKLASELLSGVCGRASRAQRSEAQLEACFALATHGSALERAHACEVVARGDGQVRERCHARASLAVSTTTR